MGYSREDLSVLALLRDKGQLEGTAYFELHPGELPEPLACWLDGSLFIRDAAFDFFVECLRRANKSFDYFDFERFEASQIDLVVHDLAALLAELTRGCPRDVLFSRYNSPLGTAISIGWNLFG